MINMDKTEIMKYRCGRRLVAADALHLGRTALKYVNQFQVSECDFTYKRPNFAERITA